MAHDKPFTDVYGIYSYSENFSYVVVDCGNPPPITNGMVIFTNTTFGSTATYSCDIYYTLTGDMTWVCEADGLYSGSEPTCNRESVC